MRNATFTCPCIDCLVHVLVHNFIVIELGIVFQYVNLMVNKLGLNKSAIIESVEGNKFDALAATYNQLKDQPHPKIILGILRRSERPKRGEVGLHGISVTLYFLLC